MSSSLTTESDDVHVFARDAVIGPRRSNRVECECVRERQTDTESPVKDSFVRTVIEFDLGSNVHSYE